MQRRYVTRRQKGQAIILIATAFIGLLLFLGVVVDLGQIFIAKAYLRKAADAASLSAAAQFREGRTKEEMEAAARQVIRLNGLDPTSVTVETCKTNPGDSELCPKPGDMPKKLVRVRIVLDYPLTFLTLANYYSVTLNEASTSEAASMDLVLVIDTSESMAFDKRYGKPGAGPMDADPSICNLDNSCQPFKQVKTAALDFAAKILNKSDPADEEDRLAIVTFATGWQQSDPYTGDLGTIVKLQWTNDFNIAKATINGLQVYDPGKRCQYDTDPPISDPGPKWDASDPSQIPLSSCREYVADVDGEYGPVDTLYYNGISCPIQRLMGIDEAWSACLTTNLGGGLFRAATYLTEPTTIRKEALWVVVLLTDGTPNQTYPIAAYEHDNEDQLKAHILAGDPIGYCPDGTYDPSRFLCQDGDSSDYHSPKTDPDYDASDYMREMSFFTACAANSPAPLCGGQTGQGAVIFTIGLGGLMQFPDLLGVPYGAKYLRDIAAVGDDGDPGTDPCTSNGLSTGAPLPWSTKNCGNFFLAPTASELDKVFDAIASRIFTRLTQ